MGDGLEKDASRGDEQSFFCLAMPKEDHYFVTCLPFVHRMDPLGPSKYTPKQSTAMDLP
jgi:hypothetical protein